MAINPENTDAVRTDQFPAGIPDGGSLFPFSNAVGKLFKMTRAEFIAFIASNSGVAKTTLDTEAGTPLVINWQTDIDPDGDGEQTYGQRHGFSVVPGIFASFESGGVNTLYNTNYSYTANGTGVLILTIPDTFTGQLTII